MDDRLAAAREELDAAAREFQELRSRFEAARDTLADKITKAAAAGIRQSEIVRTTGYAREHVRRICRQAGITPDA